MAGRRHSDIVRFSITEEITHETNFRICGRLACRCLSTCRLRHQRPLGPGLDNVDRRRKRLAEFHATRGSQLDGIRWLYLGEQKNVERRGHPALERVVYGF